MCHEYESVGDIQTNQEKLTPIKKTAEEIEMATCEAYASFKVPDKN